MPDNDEPKTEPTPEPDEKPGPPDQTIVGERGLPSGIEFGVPEGKPVLILAGQEQRIGSYAVYIENEEQLSAKRKKLFEDFRAANPEVSLGRIDRTAGYGATIRKRFLEGLYAEDSKMSIAYYATLKGERILRR